ncbi:MAG: hypothetical protein Ct9H300mP31_07510 [Acidimicrobiaceae bacterium]|nr:MAG: hypothetical protein Ct9H300mP31_07510 [Acidimicrobiaceae bacterium]
MELTANQLATELVDLGRSAGLDAVVWRMPPLPRGPSGVGTSRAAGLSGGMQFTYRNPERSTIPAAFWKEPDRCRSGPANAGSRLADVGAGRFASPLTRVTTTMPTCGGA